MLIWIVYIHQPDGSVVTKPFIQVDDIPAFVQETTGKHVGSLMPSHPKLGDYSYFTNNGNRVAYAILGQVRFN